MEKIGTTQDRQILVKMSPDEYAALEMLATVIEGSSLMGLRTGAMHNMKAVDIETALGAVREYAINRDLMNDAIKMMSAVREIWDKPKKTVEEVLDEATVEEWPLDRS